MKSERIFSNKLALRNAMSIALMVSMLAFNACDSDDSDEGPKDCDAKNGLFCGPGEACINGTCSLVVCTGANEGKDLCSTPEGKKCIDVKADSADHCGACNRKCSEQAVDNATSNTCALGKCVFACAVVNGVQYVNVGSGSDAGSIHCINPKTDNDYCGATEMDKENKQCGLGKSCVDGACILTSCVAENNGKSFCETPDGNQCLDLNVDNADHCGACNFKCSQHEMHEAKSDTCVAGKCIYSCSIIEEIQYINVGTGVDAENIHCINPMTDNDYCGATENDKENKQCGLGEACTDGVCELIECVGDENDGKELCETPEGKQCIDINIDNSDHCGECNYKCSEHAVTNATSDTCAEGKCIYACSVIDGVQYINIGTDTDKDNIKCVNPKTSDDYCGVTETDKVGSKCVTGERCIEGKCSLVACSGEGNEGKELCDTPDGKACIDVKSDNAEQCGHCDYKCADHPLLDAVSDTCAAGKCVYVCSVVNEVQLVNVGSGTDENDIKCIDPMTDSDYCGATESDKGNQCKSGAKCVEGKCDFQSCIDDNEGKELCDTPDGKQCIDIHADDAEHCGACNIKCGEHPTEKASSSTCAEGKCVYACSVVEKVQYINVGTGTEEDTIQCIDPMTNAEYCGATDTTKGIACQEGQSCVNGECIIEEA